MLNMANRGYPETCSHNKTTKNGRVNSCTYFSIFRFTFHFYLPLLSNFFFFFCILYVKDDIIIKIKLVRMSYIKLSKYATEKPGCFDDATSTNGERYTHSYTGRCECCVREYLCVCVHMCGI